MRPYCAPPQTIEKEVTRAFDAATSRVTHMHSTHCVTLSLMAHSDALPPAITSYFIIKDGYLPVIPYHRPGLSDTADAVATMIAWRGPCGVPIQAAII